MKRRNRRNFLKLSGAGMLTVASNASAQGTVRETAIPGDESGGSRLVFRLKRSMKEG